MFIPPEEPLSSAQIAKALLKKKPPQKNVSKDTNITMPKPSAADIIETPQNRQPKHKKELQILNVWI